MKSDYRFHPGNGLGVAGHVDEMLRLAELDPNDYRFTMRILRRRPYHYSGYASKTWKRIHLSLGIELEAYMVHALILHEVAHLVQEDWDRYHRESWRLKVSELLGARWGIDWVPPLSWGRAAVDGHVAELIGGCDAFLQDQ